MINNIWYHGTNIEDITHFTSKIAWFTTDIDYASSFGSILYSCTIEPKRIFNAGNTDGRIFTLMPIKPYKFSPEFEKIITELGLDLKDEELKRELRKLAEENDYQHDGYAMRIFTFVRSKYFAQKLIEQGYDAISAIEFGNECLGVLDPTIITINSIKKAETNNSTLYYQKELQEEYLDDEKEIYTTQSAYDAANIIKQSQVGLRILWDRNLKRFFICTMYPFIHRDMAEKAVDMGYYNISKWELDNYLDDYGKNVIYYIYAPKGSEDDIYGGKASEDGYEGQYVYDFGTITTRSDDRYKTSPLAKALGKYKAHYIWDGWIDQYTPNIIQVESFKEDLKDDAKKYFGVTNNWKLGFYINTDGTILDGSGKALGGNGYNRSVDHREISDLFDSICGTDALIAYMCEGNIRLIPELPGFELIKEPTEAQYKTLEKIINNFRDKYYVDISNNAGKVLWSKEYSIFDDSIQDIKKYFRLNEDTRNTLINKSRNAGTYKDQSFGKNRFERKKYSKVANAVKEYNQINMDDFFKKDILTVKVPVQGETDSYIVSIKIEGVVAEIAKNVKANSNKFEFRTVIQALTKIFNTGNVWVNCTCLDHVYNFSHWNIINNVSTEDTAHDPGPGKNIRNPKDDKGRGCKHVLLVLNNQDWLMKVASVINNYIHYAEEHMQKPFLKLIFPKIYGIPADEMIEQDLIDDEKFLDSSKGLIDAINTYGAKRGQYKPGTNKNPVTKTGGRTKKEEEKEEK